MSEREITGGVDLCDEVGNLAKGAVGWSRQPLHNCNLGKRWGRRKRWDYWCVTGDTHLLAITYANLDYLGLAVVMFVDLQTGRMFEKAIPVPFALGFSQPSTVGGADIRFDRLGLRIDIRRRGNTTQLRAGFSKLRGRSLEAEIVVAHPPRHETLNVVIPWSDSQFQFTSKQNTLPATGYVRVSGEEYAFDRDNHAFACLDFGRGVWPARTIWNWASASGLAGGHVVGLQFGGKWTDGTGMTENGLCVDGRLSKLSETVLFDYDRRDFERTWTLRSEGSDRVRLTFAPVLHKPLNVNLGVAGAEVHGCFGHFTGTVITDEGKRIAIDRMLGWAEEMRARW